VDWRDWHGAACLNYSLVAIAAAALIVVSVYSPGGAWINRGLSVRPLVRLGKYSYALYIFHYPLDFIFRRFGLHSISFGWALPYAAMLTGSSLAVAWVSWRVIEEPCIRLKDRYFSYKSRARAAAA
jgi:peptidoglycan/LPS O-acetylase OafA/YrhL